MVKQALITGAARRIGKSLALGLAEQGWDIALHYHTSRDAAIQTRSEIEAAGRRCVLFQSDLTDTAGTAALFGSVYTAFPDLSLIINSASLFIADSPASAGKKGLQDNLAIHLISPWILIQQFAEKCQKGVIINIIDTKVSDNDITRFSYTMSKRALADLTRMTALAYAPNVRINGIAPGAVLPPGDNPSIPLDPIRANPMKRIVALDSILETVVFLIENRDITGQIIAVDGGQNLV